MAARGVRGGDRWRTNLVLLLAVAFVAALGLAQPAFADNGTSTPSAATTDSEPAQTDPAADPTPSNDPPPPDPESTDPDPAPQDPPNPPEDTSEEPTDPPPVEEPPAGEIVTMEPDPCASSACETGDADESPQQDAESAPPPATAPTVVPTTTSPSAASAASGVLVVSLAPEQAAASAEADAAAGLENSTDASAEVLAPVSVAAPAVQLAGVPVQVAQLAEGTPSHAGVAAAVWSVAAVVPPLGVTPLTYLPIVNGVVIAPGTIVHGARASPRERDGHQIAATEAEEQEPPSAAVSPTGPLENQGLGAGGGSAGGVAGAASSRYFAIATTPMRFDFPSTFAHVPLPSSVPEGALEAAPTTRPG